jgi:phage terminase large subunit GpA-like protein
LLHWPPKATPVEAERASWLVCPRCGGVIEEPHKHEMNRRGEFVAPGQTIAADGEIAGDPPAAGSRSRWVSGLCSPFVTFGERAATYLTALETGEQDKIQTAVNAGFGECYLPGGGDVPEWQELHRLRQPYKPRTVPDWVRLLTCGVDVQKDRVIYATRGWGARGKSALIDQGEIFGDTADVEVWHKLGEYLADPIEGLPIKVMFVDSGFRPGKKFLVPVHRVYEFCRRHRRAVFPTKGLASARLPLRASKIEVKPDGPGAAAKAAKYGLTLYLLDTDHWKFRSRADPLPDRCPGRLALTRRDAGRLLPADRQRGSGPEAVGRLSLGRAVAAEPFS